MAETTDTRPKPYCFVLMPFSEDFDDVYSLGIRESCAQAGAFCERVDEQIFQGTILERIYNQIAKADFIVADMTGRNPNVFYEVGYAHALGKPTILLTQNVEDIPFDLRHFPHIIYQRKITALIEELTKRVKWFIENPGADGHAAQIEIQLRLGQQSLSGGEVVHTIDINADRLLDITVENSSARTLRPGEYGVGIIAPPAYHFRGERTILSDGRAMHMLSSMPVVLPGACTALRCEFEGSPNPGGRDQMTFRVFTDAGARDFALAVERPSDMSARQRLLRRAAEECRPEDRNAALKALVTIWPDEDTRQFVRLRAEKATDYSCRTSALEILAEKWSDESTREFLQARYRDDPHSGCRERALRLLARKLPDERTSALLREAIFEAPTGDLRGVAFWLLAGLHSEFGRRLATRDCDDRAPYLDPRNEHDVGDITQAHIRLAAERAMVRPADIGALLAGLKDHLGWDPTTVLE